MSRRRRETLEIRASVSVTSPRMPSRSCAVRSSEESEHIGRPKQQPQAGSRGGGDSSYYSYSDVASGESSSLEDDAKEGAKPVAQDSLQSDLFKQEIAVIQAELAAVKMRVNHLRLG